MKPVLIVTGGSQGIGAAVARLAARRGWAVALTYVRSKDLAEGIVAEITNAGGQAIAVQTEMADEASVVGLFRTVDAKLGQSARWSTTPAPPARSARSARSRPASSTR